MSGQPQEPTENRAERAPPAAIRRLPDALIDQIAAGEVVERPASVVKELVENAVDAGAGRVRVEVRGGGIDAIAVTDDGSGMTPDQARLALERHATSKIARFEDLLRIGSFGFRGEALPAIASVSRLRLRTRARDREEGFELAVEAGRVLTARATGAPVGTRVEVAELFAAVPARRKFLKTPATEWGHVSDWLVRAALALPEIHFDVLRDDRPALHWPATEDPLARIAGVLSERDAAALVAAEGAAGGQRLRAFVSRPEAHRPTGAGIHLFVNRRPVRDRLLRHALLQVYRDVLPRGRFPTALLFLEVEPEAVDVNVHPAKWEVRFGDPRSVHRLVAQVVGEALATRHWLGGAGGARPAPAGEPGRVAEPAGDWLFAARPAGEPARPAAPTPAPVPDAESPGAATRPFQFRELRLLGQLLGTYLVAEHKGGLLLVDQHAAHERVLYERLRAGWLEGGAERQALLAPAVVEMEERCVAALAAHAALVEGLGFEAEAFGSGAAMLRAVPALLAERDPAGLLRGLAEELAEAEAAGAELRPGTRLLDSADRLFATLACHASRRAGDVLPAGEQRALLDALDAIPWAPTCPHGRPVAVALPIGELERRFGRA